MNRELNYSGAINEAMHQAMEHDANVITFGLGVDDPKAIFGTTLGLKDRFGSKRVFDMPTSENAMTGVAVGAAMLGIRPVMVHQRLDFFLLAMDQLVNSAAKWHFMFGGLTSVPITIRLIIGRGWGQGPTHSQNLQAWFAHIPGLKVVMPANAQDAKGLLLSSIFDPNPVLFLEHRWLHNLSGDVPKRFYKTPIGSARTLRPGNDITVVALSYMVIEGLHAVEHLADEGIDCELIDLRTVSPIDWEVVFVSVRKTGRLIALDTGHTTGSIAGEILARVCTECWHELKAAPQRIAMPDFPEGTSPALTKNYHPRAENIVDKIAEIMGKVVDSSRLLVKRKHPHDVPGSWFNGPF